MINKKFVVFRADLLERNSPRAHRSPRHSQKLKRGKSTQLVEKPRLRMKRSMMKQSASQALDMENNGSEIKSS